MAPDKRRCDQCGEVFTPRREHARFCTARCRVLWNRRNVGEMPAETDALDWSIAAMWQAIDRLGRVSGCDRDDGFALISEAVWWVTMVDATVVRYHGDAYSDLLADLSESERTVTEDTFGGLRFVRNRLAYDDVAHFVRPVEPATARAAVAGNGRGRRADRATAGAVGSWLWVPVPEPVAPVLTSRARQWEMDRYRSYQAQLAGHPAGETFDRAAAFLRQACRPAQLSQP